MDERYNQQHPKTKLLLHKNVKFISKEGKQLDNHSSLNTPEIGDDLKKENSCVANSLEGAVLVNNFKEHDTIMPDAASQEKLNNGDKIYKEEEVSQRSSEEGKNLYDCDMPMCTYKGKTKDLLRSHKARHKKSIEKLYTCSYCGNVFNEKQSLKYHEKTKHSNNQYVCEKCPYKGYNIQDHMSWTHGKKNFSCKSCDYKSKRSRNLQCHIISKHSTSAEKRESGSRINLLATKLYSTEGVKYKCKKCPYITGGPSNIYKHEITHKFTENKRNIIKF